MTREELQQIARWLQDHGFGPVVEVSPAGPTDQSDRSAGPITVVIDYSRSEIRLLLEPQNTRF